MKKEIKKYKDGLSVRLKNKRITVFDRDEKINVLLQAALPKEDLNFNDCGIRHNYKQTAFALSREAAITLCYTLKEVLLLTEKTDSNDKGTME